MSKRIRNSFWVVGLILLGFPVGYMHGLVYNKRVVCSEFVLNIVAGGIAFFLVVGGFSYIIYRIIKKRSKDPSKYALLVYSVLILIFFLISAPWYKSALIDCGL